MYNPKALGRIEIIKKKIIFIHNIISEKGSVIKALEDEQNTRASILMHLTSIAEQSAQRLCKNTVSYSPKFLKTSLVPRQTW